MKTKMHEAPIDGRTLRYQHRRPELLNAVTEYVLDHGIGDLSLRPIATAIGVTHSTLLRHFSTKEQLLLEVLQKIRVDFEAQIANDEEVKAATSTIERLRLSWQRLCRPKEQRQFVLLFELVARVAQAADPKEPLAHAILSDWTNMIGQSLQQDGWSPEEASMRATLLLAQIRGMQIDVLMTGERERIDRAFELGLTVFARK